MSELVITPNFTKKTARFHGAVAAGEHAAVRISGAASLLPDTPSDSTLRLRVVFLKKTLAVFPFVTAAMVEADDSLTQDVWEADGDDLICTLNLNTTQALKAFRKTPEMEVLAVLDDPVQHQLYFSDLVLMRGWPQEPADAPTNLDDYRDFVADTRAALAAHTSAISENASAMEQVNAALAEKANNSDLDSLATKEELEAEADARQAVDAGHDADLAAHEDAIEDLQDGIEHAEAHITEHALDNLRHCTENDRVNIRATVAALFAEKNYDLSTTDGFVDAFIDVVETLGGTAHD